MNLVLNSGFCELTDEEALNVDGGGWLKSFVSSVATAVVTLAVTAATGSAVAGLIAGAAAGAAVEYVWDALSSSGCGCCCS